MNRLETLKQAVVAAGMDYSLIALADLLLAQWPASRIEELQLALLLQQAVQQGHVCLLLDEVAGKARQSGFSQLAGHSPSSVVDSAPFIGRGDDERPLVEDADRLYLQRMFYQEQSVAEDLLQRSLVTRELTDAQARAIEALFPQKGRTDYQKLAVIDALRHGFTIVSGGPGTGKTWTVARLIRLLIEQQPDLHIALAAPTGKAAARMSESLRQSLQDMPDELHARLPQKAVTLHRLLRVDYRSHRPGHDRDNPLRCDVLILDEASMIDQNLMHAVCQALPSEARLVLLGDKDQLASVEAGSVFADLCGGLEASAASADHRAWLEQAFKLPLPLHEDDFPLANQVVVLQESRRFGEHSGIGQMARAINRGEADECLRLLQREDLQDIAWQNPKTVELASRYQQIALARYAAVIEAESIEQAMERFKRYRVLCAQWEGPRGVHFINHSMDLALKQQQGLRPEETHYAGKPLMLTRNLHAHGLHNGDIGILWKDDSGELRLWIENDEGGLQAFSLAQLPPHETAYAMTVHKSQGSEFDEVLLVMPEQENELCTRELLYTGITRARNRITLWAGETLLRNAVKRATRRRSGLRERLTQMARV